MLDLKYFRENILEISLDEFSKIIDIPIGIIIEYERDNNKSNSKEFLDLLSSKTDYLVEELINFNNTTSESKYNFIPNDDYKNIEEIKLKIKSFQKDINDFDCDNEVKIPIYNILESINTMIKKPSIAFIGNSDVGKSSMINFLLGKNISPSKLRPVTSSLIKIVHIEDRPTDLKENVYILSNLSFNVKDFRNIIIDKGGYELIDKYGIHNGNNNDKVKEIIAYVDSPMLKMCEIWDLPGLASAAHSGDDKLSMECIIKSDMVFFLSGLDSFLDNNESDCLRKILSILENKKPNYYLSNNVYDYKNLFIIATKVDNQTKQIPHTNRYKLDKEEIDRVLYEGVKDAIFRLALPSTSKVLYKRTFAFSTKTDNEILENYRTIIYNELKNSLNTYKNHSINRNITLKNQWIEKFLNDKSEEINKLSKDYNETFMRIEKLNSQSYINNVRIKNDEVVKKSKEIIDKFKKKSISEVRGYFKALDEDAIVALMKLRNVTKKKKDIKIFCTDYLNSKISKDIEEILEKSTNGFTNEMKLYFDNIKLEDMEEFDVMAGLLKGIENTLKNRALLGAVSGAAAGGATLGALGALAASAGNLGGYILVTQAVSILADLGMGFGFTGGTAGVVALTSALGGPIVWAILAAILAGGIIFGFINAGEWRNKIAKKIKAALDKEKVSDEYVKNIETYWDNTANSIPLNFVFDEYCDELSKLNTLIKNKDYEDYKEYKEKFDLFKKYILIQYKELFENVN